MDVTPNSDPVTLEQLYTEMRALHSPELITVTYSEKIWSMVENDFRELFPKKKFTRISALSLIPEIIEQYREYFRPEVERLCAAKNERHRFLKNEIQKLTSGEKWYANFSTSTQERIFGVMRSIDSASCRHRETERALMPRFGEIAVGSTFFDHTLMATMLEEFLQALRNGMNPDAACDAAELAGIQCVKIHNSRREDINWQRSEDVSNKILYFVQQVWESIA